MRYHAGSADGRGGVMVDPRDGPIVPRLVLGVKLRRLREGQGISREDAGKAIQVSTTTIDHLELGRAACKLRDVVDLCALYGVDDHAERAMLLGLARRTNLPAWWQAYQDVVPGWFEDYLGLEQAADIIRGFEVQFVPGLLQTAGYARAVIMLGHGDAARTQIDRRLDLRLRRQRILHRARPPRLWAVIDEGALRRPIGSAAIMFSQLEHLIDVCELPHVTVQVLPFRAGGHAAAGGPVTLLRMPEPELPDVIYLEQLTAATYLDQPPHAQYYWHILNRLATQAEPSTATPATLRRMLRQL